jgi:hypothetical protein
LRGLDVILIAFLFVFAVYLLVFYGFARLVRRVFEKRGKHLAGRVMVWFIMFSSIAVVFWDAIPTWLTHRRLCETEFGLKVYVTPEEWVKNNPERFSQIKPVSGLPSSETIKSSRIETRVEHINSEFDTVWSREMGYGFGVLRDRYQLVDRKTGQVLAEMVNFYGGVSGGSIATGANSLADYKIWLATGSCKPASADVRAKYQEQIDAAGKLFNKVRDWGNK